MAKTLLIVADAYYPLTLAGAHRPAKMAKFLPEFGWSPIVLCREWTAQNSGGHFDPELGPAADRLETIRVPHVGLSTALSNRLARRVERTLWPYCAPVRLVRAMRSRHLVDLKGRRIDAVWSSYKPGFVHHVARAVALSRRIPWVADFRDLPDQASSDLTARREVRAERRLCSAASLLTVTTPVLAAKLAARHAKPVHVIENGFDEEDYPASAPAPSPHFVIAYFGILYPFRDPRPLFEALDCLTDKAAIRMEDIRVRFYGVPGDLLDALCRGFRCRPMVEALPRVGRGAALRLQCEASVLLDLQSKAAGGAVPSKLMEYLGARRPILNIPGDEGPIDDILRRTGAGHAAASVPQITGLLGVWYQQWRTNGAIPFAGSSVEVARFSRKEQARILARLLDQACGA